MRFTFFLLVSICISSSLNAQTQHQNTGWLLLLNNTKISEKWGIYADVQVRSGDRWQNVRNLLIRPGVTYYANSKNEITLGYLLNQTYTHLDGAADQSLSEHRIWEQYVYKHKISTINVSHRFRLEQRFIERLAKEDLFAQRLRYFVRFMLPLEKNKNQFTNGFYAALQNELFFNIQHKSELNNKLFDQNRGYVAAGYRLNKSWDMEIGYMNQATKGLSSNTVNNIIQLAIYTKF